MQEIKAESFSNLCRLCGEDDECYDLFGEERQGALLLSKIQLSIRITIAQDDGLPTGVCDGCQKKLMGFSAFYEQCHDTQVKLQEFLSIESAMLKSCHEEPVESDIDEEGHEDNTEEYYFYDEAPADSNVEEVGAEVGRAAEDEPSIEFMEIDASEELGGAQTLTLPAMKNTDTQGGSFASLKNNKEEGGPQESDKASGLISTPPLRLYQPLSSGDREPSDSLSLENCIGIPSFDDSEKNCSSFCKEMDVLLCCDTDSQQTVSHLTCCSEPRPLTSPSFSLHPEDFSLDQGGHIPIGEFPLTEQQLTPFKSTVEKETRHQLPFTSDSPKPLASLDNLSLPGIETEVPLQNSFALAAEIEESLVEQALGPQYEKSVIEPAFDPQTRITNPVEDLESLPSLPSPSVSGTVPMEVNIQQLPSEASSLLTVDAKVVGASGEIKFQRNAGGVKIVFPPTTAEKALKFEDLINLFALSEVREAFCAESKQEEIIQQLVQQGLGNSGVPTSGRASVLSVASSLDLPNSILSPLSVCDSWSWEISQLLSGDENSNQGDGDDNRSELNTPIVTLPQKLSNEEAPLKLLPSTQVVPPSPSVAGGFCISPSFETVPTTSGNFPLNIPSSNINFPQRVFTPLQVQIPEETDTSVRMSRTLQSCNTYFDELSLGISPVLDLDPNVATVRMSCPPTESSQLSLFRKNLDAPPSLQIGGSDNIPRIDIDSNIITKDDDCDIKEVAVDIIIDDGKTNWLKLLPDPTDEFIKKISHKCYKCHICSKSFKFKFQVQRHIKINHSTAKPFICAICGATFSIKYYLTRHMKHHDSSNKFHCSMCDRSFTRHYQLTEHEASHRDPSSLKCSDCGKQSNSKTALNVHRSICSGNLQSYICDICGKTYPGLTALNHHRARHASEKSFKCTMCESSFHTQWQLVKHTKRHATQGLYVCKFCSLAFNSTSNLKKHMAKCPALTVNKIVKKDAVKN